MGKLIAVVTRSLLLGSLLLALPAVTATQGQIPPKIERVETFREGILVFFRLFYADLNNDAEGFGFRGANGSGWAEETHPFSSPSYGRWSPGIIEYPFNHLCGEPGEYESDIEAWIYDSTGLRSQSVTIHLACSVLEGPDANGNGVWDYIEGHIDQTYSEPTTRAAIRAIAVAMQSAMLVANDPAASVNAATALQRAIECLYFVRPDDARAVKNDVKAVLLNTFERSKAYLQFSDQLGGQIFPTTPLSELQSACNF